MLIRASEGGGHYRFRCPLCWRWHSVFNDQIDFVYYGYCADADRDFSVRYHSPAGVGSDVHVEFQPSVSSDLVFRRYRQSL